MKLRVVDVDVELILAGLRNCTAASQQLRHEA